MKRMIVFFTLVLFVFSGCSGNSSNSNDNYRDSGNAISRIYDKEGNEIGSIERYGLITLADDKLFVTKNAVEVSSGKKVKSYYLFDLVTKEKTGIGTVSGYVSEAWFDRVLIGDHLYTSMTIGQNNDRNNWMYTLLDIDLKNKTMNTLLQEKSTFVYNHLARADDDLLLLRKGNGGMKIERYSPADGSISLLKQYTYNDDSHTGETARDLYYRDGILYVLRLESHGEKTRSDLFVDRYDKSMKLISSTNVTDITNSDLEGLEDEEKQVVNEFICTGDLLYYENRSITQFLGKIEGGKLSPIIHKASGEQLSVSKTANDQGKYRFFFFQSAQNGGRYCILNTENGEFTEGEIHPKNTDGLTVSSIVQGEKNVMFTMTDPKSPASLDREFRIYYYDIEDLLKKQ